MNDFAQFKTWIWQKLKDATGLPVFHEVVPDTAKFPCIRFSVPAFREWPAFVEPSGVQTGLLVIDVFSGQQVSAEAENILTQVIQAVNRTSFKGSSAEYGIGLTNVRIRWEDSGRYWMASADFALHRIGNA